MYNTYTYSVILNHKMLRPFIVKVSLKGYILSPIYIIRYTEYYTGHYLHYNIIIVLIYNI